MLLDPGVGTGVEWRCGDVEIYMDVSLCPAYIIDIVQVSKRRSSKVPLYYGRRYFLLNPIKFIMLIHMGEGRMGIKIEKGGWKKWQKARVACVEHAHPTKTVRGGFLAL